MHRNPDCSLHAIFLVLKMAVHDPVNLRMEILQMWHKVRMGNDGWQIKIPTILSVLRLRSGCRIGQNLRIYRIVGCGYNMLLPR